jgi:glycosyltransferase involved in cell wall biosynthesis
MPEPRITAIVSTYAAQRFMRGCLEDLVAQTLLDEMEILVIDSGSPQGEGAICEEFARAHPQIRYLRTEREPIYATWNRAIGLARGTYLTSSNTDDRHRPEFMAAMVEALDSNPEIALVYGEKMVSHTENETFAMCLKRGARVQRLPEFDLSDLLLSCYPGSQPVWRKSLHEEFGLFDTRYRIAADYDMWLRFATKYSFMKLPGVWGSFYESERTLSGTGQRIALNFEVLDMLSRSVKQPRWSNLPGLRKRLAADFFRRGYQHVEKERNSRAGLPFFVEAIKLDPMNFAYLKTFLVRGTASLFGLVTGRRI